MQDAVFNPAVVIADDFLQIEELPTPNLLPNYVLAR